MWIRLLGASNSVREKTRTCRKVDLYIIQALWLAHFTHMILKFLNFISINLFCQITWHVDYIVIGYAVTLRSFFLKEKFLQNVCWSQFSGFASVDFGKIYWVFFSTENVSFSWITNSFDRKEANLRSMK